MGATLCAQANAANGGQHACRTHRAVPAVPPRRSSRLQWAAQLRRRRLRAAHVVRHGGLYVAGTPPAARAPFFGRGAGRRRTGLGARRVPRSTNLPGGWRSGSFGLSVMSTVAFGNSFFFYVSCTSTYVSVQPWASAVIFLFPAAPCCAARVRRYRLQNKAISVCAHFCVCDTSLVTITLSIMTRRQCHNKVVRCGWAVL